MLLKESIELRDTLECTSIGNDLKSKVVIRLDCHSLFEAGTLRKHDKADVAVVKLGTEGTDLLIFCLVLERHKGLTMLC